MSNNINISSGSKSSQNKIFGSITKLTKPSFAYEGKIFSDNTFDNQRSIPQLENNIYYFNQGLLTELIFQIESLNIQSGGSSNGVSKRNDGAVGRGSGSSFGGGSSGFLDPNTYDRNRKKCTVP